MTTYSYSEARERLSVLLERALLLSVRSNLAYKAKLSIPIRYDKHRWH